MIITFIFAVMMIGMCWGGFILAQAGALSDNKFTLNSGIGMISIAVFGFVIMPIVSGVQEQMALDKLAKLKYLQEIQVVVDN
jgi:hypothetical protein